MLPELPQRSLAPNAGLLKSPNRPFGKSSQVATLSKSIRPGSLFVVGIDASVCVASRAAVIGVTTRSGSALLDTGGRGASFYHFP